MVRSVPRKSQPGSATLLFTPGKDAVRLQPVHLYGPADRPTMEVQLQQTGRGEGNVLILLKKRVWIRNSSEIQSDRFFCIYLMTNVIKTSKIYREKHDYLKSWIRIWLFV